MLIPSIGSTYINARRHELSIFPLHLKDYVFSLRGLFTRKFLLPQKYNQDV